MLVSSLNMQQLGKQSAQSRRATAQATQQCSGRTGTTAQFFISWAYAAGTKLCLLGKGDDNGDEDISGFLCHHVERHLSLSSLLGTEKTKGGLWQQKLSEQLDFGALWRT